MRFFHKKKNIKSIIPKGFTDIHSHVLFGIDDGARTIEDSILMIKKFIELGIYKIIATPHVISGVWPNSTEIILKTLSAVKNRIKLEGLSEFTIHAAAEYMLDENFNELIERRDLLPIKKNMILVEMSYFSPPTSLFDTLFSMQVAGYTPIIAHPERYYFYHNHESSYPDLRRSGAELQLNLLSLTDYYGKDVQKAALDLLENNMYQYVGTDAHNIKHLENISYRLSKKHFKLLESLMLKQTFF